METLLSALGIKKALLAAGIAGGGLSGALMPGPLAVLAHIAARILVGALAGGVIANYGAAGLAAELGRPDQVLLVALGLGLFGLTTVFKIGAALNGLDFAAIINRKIGGNS